MKVDEMTDQERRVYNVLMTNETKLSDGYMYYVPFHFIIDGYWVDAEQDAVFLDLIKQIIRTVNYD